MMEYYDQHAHTHFSFDSSERLENYLSLSDKFVVTTEHLDFRNPINDFRNDFPDYVVYTDEVNTLNKRYNNRILKGIEVGYTQADSQAIKAHLLNQTYDVMLLSVHQNGKYDFMDDAVLSYPLEATMKEYFKLMLAAVEDFSQANVLAHFEYGLRRYSVTVEDLKKAEPLLKQIFQIAVNKDLAFELNSKSMYKYKNEHLYEYAIDLYKSLGGKYFTVGSDAHLAEDYEFRFNDMFKMLAKHDVQYLTVFQNQSPILVERP